MESMGRKQEEGMLETAVGRLAGEGKLSTKCNHTHV